jgi:cell division protein FtsI (penicillin-binding protein 3)
MERFRLTLLGVTFFVGFGIVLFRSAQLQLFPNKSLAKISEKQMNQNLEIVGRRGVVTDRNGRELSVSVNSRSIFVNPKLVKNKKLVIKTLARVLEISEKEATYKYEESSGKKFFWFARQLNKNQLNNLNSVQLSKLDGVGVIPEFRREYPNKSLASHVLGFVSIDGTGIEGVEKQFDDELMGMTQKTSLAKDALGRPLFSQVEQIQLEQNQGSRIELTLDSRIQHIAEKVLKDTVQHHKAEGGTVIVMNPFNGELLALANYPTFDPNSSKSFPVSMRRNRSITDPIEPGSVLKPFVVAKAIDDKVVSPETVLPTFGGFLKVKDKIIGESDAKHRFEKLSVKDVIRVSSNVGMVVLKDRMGFERVDEIYRQIGFGSKTGIELSGESRGIYKTPTKNQLVEQATLSFGQGLAVTPLQIASAYAVLANGGFRVQPHIVRKVSHSKQAEADQSFFESESVDLKERILQTSTIEKMKAILEKVVQEEGTGIAAHVEGFKVAGKTGTSQRVDYENGGYEAGAYWSLFSGYLPSDNPRFVITVMIDRPTENGFYGGQVAAPAFARIAREAIRSHGLVLESSIKPKTR